MTSAPTMATAKRLRTHDRLLLHLSWGLVLAVFLSIGWMAMKPWDPHGAVSLLSHGDPVLMAVEVLALAAVMSALATVLAGRAFPDVGVFAVGVGLAGASLQGNTTSSLLIDRGGGNLAPSLAMESFFWCAVMALAMLSSAAVVRWRTISSSGMGPDRASPAGETVYPLGQMAAANIPVAGRLLLGGGRTTTATDWRDGLKHLGMATAIALILIRILAAGAPDGAIRHGQAIFAISVGVYVGVRQAQKSYPVSATLWPCLTAPVVCLLAMAWSWLMAMGDGTTSPPSIPASTYLRALPITYISVGTVAALLAIWPALRARAPGGVG